MLSLQGTITPEDKPGNKAAVTSKIAPGQCQPVNKRHCVSRLLVRQSAMQLGDINDAHAREYGSLLKYGCHI